MGYPGKNTKQYETPVRRFESSRMEEEVRLIIEYGLRNKREVWKAESTLRRYRRAARDLLALTSQKPDSPLIQLKRRDLLGHLHRMGLVKADADIDDVLALKVGQELERRLQTFVYRKGLARSPKQARQFITHGHIAIGDVRVTIPSYRVRTDEEPEIRYYPHSSLAHELNPERGRIMKGGR
ncbi:MAG: 30S ribosomal protein S4 [Methanomicrobiales archaeon]|nr:30S ribosomal protein S4 [Methanomicrobiales archaeon]